MKRLFCLIAAMGLLLVSVPAASAHNNSCQNATAYNDWTGHNISAGTSWTGIEADIDPATIGPSPDGFMACDDSNGLDAQGASSAWVAIEGTDTDPDKILQIGVINCDDILYAVCDPQGSTGLHWFWAVGGCTGSPSPQPIDDNPNVSNISRNYGVYRYYTGPGSYYFVLTINGVVKKIVYPDDPAVACWINSSWKLAVAGERWDRGDDFGSTSFPTKINNVQRRAIGFNGYWTSVTVGSCEFVGSDTGCTTSGDDTSIWTSGS